MGEKISALSVAATLDGSELVPVVQSGATKKTTTQDIADLGGGSSSYLVYTAIMSQSGTDAPVATILGNTIGAVVWSRSGVGNYRATLSGAFPSGKTYLQNQIDVFLTSSADETYTGWVDANSIAVQTYVSGSLSDDGVWYQEIRVYP